MVSIDFEAKFVASLFMARGIAGTFFFMSGAVGGITSLSYGSGLMSFMIALLGLSSIITFVSYGLTNRRYWSWLIGSLTALIYLTTDITLTVLGHPQPIWEFIIDSSLVIYFLTRRDTFRKQGSEQTDLNEKIGSEG